MKGLAAGGGDNVIEHLVLVAVVWCTVSDSLNGFIEECGFIKMQGFNKVGCGFKGAGTPQTLLGKTDI